MELVVHTLEVNKTEKTPVVKGKKRKEEKEKVTNHYNERKQPSNSLEKAVETWSLA